MSQPLPRANASFVHTDMRRTVVRLSSNERPRRLSGAIGLVAGQRPPESSFEDDPRADEAARWLAARALRELERPQAIEPLIEELLERVISDCVGDVETSKAPGAFIVRPVVTERIHNLADYTRFEDLFELPTGAAVGPAEEPEVQTFLGLAAAKSLEIVNSALVASARLGLTKAPAPLRGFLQELARAEALEAFAQDAAYDLAVSEQFDEYNLVEDLADLSFLDTLLARRPDQAERLAADRAFAAEEDSGERAWRLKSSFIIGQLLRDLSANLQIWPLSDIVLFTAILRHTMGKEEEIDDDEFDFVDFASRLAHNWRLCGLLPRRQQDGFLRMVGEWRRRIGERFGDLDGPLARLYRSRDQFHNDEGVRWTVRILQEKRASTFDETNWPFLLAYALGLGDNRLALDFRVVVTRRETIDSKKGPRPIETSAGLLIKNFDVNYLSAAETERLLGAHVRSHATNPMRRFEDAHDLVGAIR